MKIPISVHSWAAKMQGRASPINGDKFHKTLHSRQVLWGSCNLSETSLIFEDLGAGSRLHLPGIKSLH